MTMVRMVVEMRPNLYTLTLVDADTLRPQFRHDDTTYYRCASKDHYVMYRAAISGWGAGGSFDEAQR